MEYACPSPETNVVFGCFFIVIMLLALVANVLMIVAFCKICAKAGYSWALGLLMLVPLANIILPIYLGFSQWPIERRASGTEPYPPANPSDPTGPQNFRNL